MTLRRPAVLGLTVMLLVGCGGPASPSGSAPSSGNPATPAPPSGGPTLTSTEPPSSASPTPAAWVAAAPMRRGRVGFDAVPLGDGTVLAVGDDYDCYPGPATQGSETAEIYDPIADEWLEVESLNKPRKGAATVALKDGSAMVIGGINSEEAAFSSTKIFSPATRTWADGPLLDVARGNPVAATLADGRVLVVSQVSVEETSGTSTTELYDPAKGAWGRSASPPVDAIERLVPMADGRMFAVGSMFEVSLLYEIYDPRGDAWSEIDSPAQGFSLTIVPLPDGSFLTLRYDDDGTQRIELLDPATGHRTDAARMPTRLDEPAVAALADGRVVFAGGQEGNEFEDPTALQTTEIYDPATDRWSAGPDLLEGRVGGSMMLLDDGSVLLFGGRNTFNTEGDVPWCPAPMTSVERFHPGS